MTGLPWGCRALATSGTWHSICSTRRPTTSLAAWVISDNEGPCRSRDPLPLPGVGGESLAGLGGVQP